MDRIESKLNLVFTILLSFVISCFVMGIGLLGNPESQGTLKSFALSILSLIAAIGCRAFTLRKFPN